MQPFLLLILLLFKMYIKTSSIMLLRTSLGLNLLYELILLHKANSNIVNLILIS